MCCCKEPNVNGTPNAYSWDGKSYMTRQPAPPALRDGDELIFDEPGRCGGVDCHSHHFRLVKRYAAYELLVRHGGGDESVPLNGDGKRILPTFELLDSNGRYWLMHALYSVSRHAKTQGMEMVRLEWRTAAAEKRIKTRKQPGRNAVKVWIEPAPAPTQAVAA